MCGIIGLVSETNQENNDEESYSSSDYFAGNPSKVAAALLSAEVFGFSTTACLTFS